jgi:SAM-dependent methyltransferase
MNRLKASFRQLWTFLAKGDAMIDQDDTVRRQMMEEWEQHAFDDPMYWIASGRTDWTLEEFYEDDSWYYGKTLLEFLTELGIELRGRKVLDLGCGMGRVSVQLARYGAEVFGTDISQEMIRLAQANLAHVPDLHFQVGDGTTLARYHDEFFDVVWSYITFRHIPSLKVILEYLDEIGRVLVPGGKFVIEVGNFRGWQWFVTDSKALRIGLKKTARLRKLGVRVRPVIGLIQYDAFYGVRVPKRLMLQALQSGGLSVDNTLTYDPYDHILYVGHR